MGYKKVRVANVGNVVIPTDLDCKKCKFNVDGKCLIFGDVEFCKEHSHTTKKPRFNIGDEVFVDNHLCSYKGDDGKVIRLCKTAKVKILGYSYITSKSKDTEYYCRTLDGDLKNIENGFFKAWRGEPLPERAFVRRTSEDVLGKTKEEAIKQKEAWLSSIGVESTRAEFGENPKDFDNIIKGDKRYVL